VNANMMIFNICWAEVPVYSVIAKVLRKKEKMLINKLMKYAEKMGLDPEELLQMTVLEASLLIEETQTMWVMLEKSVE
jgi:hypothetical protein